jgi:hypothetical protein
MRPSQSIHSFTVVVACLTSALCAAGARADIEPYQARVTAARALVYSGPGEKFYPSRALSSGETVDVYREDGSWLGIRPPEGSFSWVPEKSVTPQGGGLAEVREDDLASRIGSELSDKRNATQVRLKRGEVVEVLDKESFDGETWLKIAPPAGEFRWIQSTSVEYAGAIGDAADEGDEREEQEISPIQTTSATSEATPVKSGAGEANAQTPPAATGEAPPVNGETWRATEAPIGALSPPPNAPAEIAAPPLRPIAGAVAEPPVAATATTPTTSTMPAATTPPGAPGATAAPPSGVPASATGSDLQRQLTDVEMRLSRMAASPPQLWNTERLQHDTEQLLAAAKTQADRDAVKVTMAKIDRFTSLARRYQQPPAPPGAAMAPGGAAGGPGTASIAQLGAAGADASRYDAVGLLRPVVSKRPGAPQFALVDDRGQVVTFVTPGPDVNLQPYLGRRVGVAGNRGFIPEFNRAHVTAGRVTPLNDRLVR